MSKPSRHGYIPTHPDLFTVDFGEDKFNSCLRATRSFDTGEYIVALEPSRLTQSRKAYTSVQCGPKPNDHVELNSDLVYTNHSCDPNVAFNFSSPNPAKWHIYALKQIEPGQAMTFFYPSTEWDMDQPFVCECNARNCLGRVRGAKYLTLQQLHAPEFVNPYILELAAERDREVLKVQSRL